MKLLCLLCCFSCVLGHAEELLFNTLRERYQKVTPQDFIAKLSGPFIDKAINKIPKNSICKGVPQARYLFIRGVTEQIVIENVEQPFASQLQQYIAFYTLIKSFFDYTKDFTEFAKIFEWKELQQTTKHHQIKIRKHISRKKDYFHLYFERPGLNLREVRFFSNNSLQNTIRISYVVANGYQLISSIQVLPTKQSDFFVDVSEYRVNLGLTKSTVMHTQDDCPDFHFLDFKSTK